MMLQAIEQCIDQRLLVEQLIPVWQIEVCSDDRRDAVVALVHQPEEGVGLFRLERQVAQLVNDQRSHPAHLGQQSSWSCGRPARHKVRRAAPAHYRSDRGSR